MQLSIIIVNWKSKDYLRKCLESVFAQTRGIDFEVIVIDSASFDGCGEMLRDSFPQVRFIQSNENLGFARANNRAVEESTGELLLFLNPDTELVGSAINILVEVMLGSKNAGAIGCRLLNTDGTLQTSCIQAFPTILNQLLDAEVLRDRFPRSSLWGTQALVDSQEKPSAVDAISGACLLVRREAFRAVGGFSMDYFMYSEDVDLCFKLRQAGKENLYVPRAVVLHHGGGSSSQAKVSTFSSVMLLESRFRFFRKTRSTAYGLLFRASMFLVSVLRITAMILAFPVLWLRQRQAVFVNTVRKWHARMRWSLGLEHWARKS